MHSSLIYAKKHRLAHTKPTIIPRLELQASVLSTKVSSFGLIHELTAVEEWHHVSGVDNPADIVSRGCSPDVLNKEMWLHGPSFLRQY